jgi:hypothetical protein
VRGAGSLRGASVGCSERPHLNLEEWRGPRRFAKHVSLFSRQVHLRMMRTRLGEGQRASQRQWQRQASLGFRAGLPSLTVWCYEWPEWNLKESR